jgi:hypothetical protein
MLAIFDEYMEFMEVLEKRRTKPYFLGAVNFRVNHFRVVQENFLAELKPISGVSDNP